MFKITDNSRKDGLGNLHVFPWGIIQKIANYSPKSLAPLSKHFYNFTVKELKSQWESLKKDGKTPAKLKLKINLIEENNPKENIFVIIEKFFKSLNSCQGIKPIRIDFSNLPNEMLTALHDDQDHNLCQLWSCISKTLDLEQPPVNAKEIRFWMSDLDNQQKLAQIRHLNLSNLKLTDLPSEIIYFTGATALELRNNLLTHVPDCIGDLSALKHLDLSNNQLRALPYNIGNLRELRQLCVGNNQLTDVPNSIGNLRLLEVLFLRGNLLMRLPDCIGDLEVLSLLACENTPLAYLPASIVNIGKNLNYITTISIYR